LKVKHYAAEGLNAKDYREHCRILLNKAFSTDLQQRINVSLGNDVPKQGYRDHISLKKDLPNILAVVIG